MSHAWTVPGLSREDTLAQNARRILAIRIAELYSYAPIVADASAVTGLHNMRIATKRLRYSLELFRAVFGETGEAQIERVKSLQEILGQLHDLDIRIELIERELTDLAREQMTELSMALASASPDDHRAMTTAALRPPPDDPRRGLLALLGRQHAQRSACHRDFAELWRQLTSAGMRRALVELSLAPGTDRQTIQLAKESMARKDSR
jgi:hypothetical protein